MISVKKLFKYGIICEGEDGERSPIWLTVYSDMMTNLSLFFLMLFVFTRLDISKQEAIHNALGKTFVTPKKEQVLVDKKMVQKLKKFLAVKKEIGTTPTISVNETKIKITMEAPVLFDSGRADLKPGALSLLSGLAQIFKESASPIVVEGYTDNLSIHTDKYDSNWELSAARAYQVIRYFTENEKI